MTALSNFQTAVSSFNTDMASAITDCGTSVVDILLVYTSTDTTARRQALTELQLKLEDVRRDLGRIAAIANSAYMLSLSLPA